ncbi:hypothetical protein [Cupriavidus taiwanensis]|uniref:hypothetical protein n=1 Tax=Cupriavidus taiwanensis TaxID=164546 RepID=UPI000E10E7EC|nr:hypothetical protein [Cupriavidus taiwanensis]SOY48515.1 conserved hypothetical protein [Cupriavidus taiwanensis]SOY83045.1 conserved hypothetical protein [Cupriavidus taiwanensis]SOZ56231.1 conserved hypothetical protein [Cupriavidus taiwanensis]SOZ78814.1 conserved hypothetical protein [Cupriavidus taiwanensis]SOZ79090.1 conserved hypothetical protein [Cupriavidus taiwanensis]
MSPYDAAPIRIPVQFINGRWEFLYGGPVPAREGTVADLVLNRGAIVDKNFLALLSKRTEHKILSAGTELLVALTVKPKVPLSDSLRKYLISKSAVSLSPNYFHVVRSGDTMFVKVSIGGPTEQQIRKHPGNDGGIWLSVQGTQPKGIVTSQVKVPQEVSETPLDSLNHAFTRLSEEFEPWRKSHTGNIYDRVLYQEKNKSWYPLNVLRDAALAQDEHELIRVQWQQIAESLRLPLLAKPSDSSGMKGGGEE